MNVKALVVIIAIVSVLVIVFMVTGVARGTSAPGDLSPGWLGAFERSEKLAPEDIRVAQPATCAQQYASGLITLFAGGECLIAVRPSDSLLPKTRNVPLRLAVGQRIEVTVRQPDIMAIERELRAGDRESFPLFGDGGSIIIRCVLPGPGGTCAVQVT